MLAAIARGPTHRAAATLVRTLASSAGGSGLVGIPGVGGWQSPPSPTKLEDVVKLGLFAHKSPSEAAEVWSKYHEDESKGRMGRVLRRADYAELSARAAESPLFVVPLEKPEGYVTLVAQWQPPRCLVTTLHEFNHDPTSSVAHLTLTHYTELAPSKGIVLVRGDAISPHVINAFEARAFTQRLYDYYLHPAKYMRWVQPFNHDANAFDFRAYMDELGFMS